MSGNRATQPHLTPKLITSENDVLELVVNKWLGFQQSMWQQVNVELDKGIKRYTFYGPIFRILIIALSASITTISEIGQVPRTVVTVVAGVLTILTGVEGFLRCTERQALIRKQQREIDALRDKLRFDWFIKVEIEADFQKRLAEAKRLLREGPEAYNEILNKYTLKEEKGEAPTANT